MWKTVSFSSTSANKLQIFPVIPIFSIVNTLNWKDQRVLKFEHFLMVYQEKLALKKENSLLTLKLAVHYRELCIIVSEKT